MTTYCYTLENDHEFVTGLQLDRTYPFCDQKGKLWLELRANGTAMVCKGYSWDGCSPKFQFKGRWFGTWDGETLDDGNPALYYPSLIHDALYQFKAKKEFPLTRSQIDALFLKEMTMVGFNLAFPYYVAVRCFGGIYSFFTR